MDGRMDGWDGRMDVDQKCPSIFLILMYFKDHVYMYLFMYSKVVTKIPIGFNIRSAGGGGGCHPAAVLNGDSFLARRW